MAGEYVVVNPRRRRRRRKARRARTAAPKRRRRRAVAANPRRRRRVGARRRVSARRRRRNPRGLSIGGTSINAAFTDALWIGGGIVGAEVIAGQVKKYLPASLQAGGMTGMGVKAAIGVAVPMLAKKFIGARAAKAIAVGAFASIVIDALRTWVLPATGLGDYEYGTLGMYQTGQLGGMSGPIEDIYGTAGSVYSGGVYS